MKRYLVLDTGGTDHGEAAPRFQRGSVLGAFMSQDSAQALALQRMASGSVSVVVVDLVKGEQVFPPPEPAADET